MPTTPLHHALARMPREMFQASLKVLPRPVIRTNDDIKALGAMFYDTDLELSVPSHEILRDPTIPRGAITRLVIHLLYEVLSYKGYELERQQIDVWGHGCRYVRREEVILFLAEAIRQDRVQSSTQLRGAVLRILGPNTPGPVELVPRALQLGARAALADAVRLKPWGVPMAHLDNARRSWEESLPEIRRTQAQDVAAAMLAERNGEGPDRAAPPMWRLVTPHDTTGGTATPAPPDTDAPWLAPPSHRTLAGWRAHGLSLHGRSLSELRMLARDGAERRDISEEIADGYPGRMVASRLGLGEPSIAGEDPLWEWLGTQLDDVRRAREAEAPLREFAAALASDPATMPASVYRAALSVCNRFPSLKLPPEVLFVFPLTRANSPLWWELYFHVIERSFSTHRTERVRDARLAQHAQRLAHPDLDDVLHTPPPEIAAASKAMTDDLTALDLMVGFALQSTVPLYHTPVKDHGPVSGPRLRS